MNDSGLPIDGEVTPVEPGLLMGFGNDEITGFAEGVMFAPVIGTIPFVGYLFRLDAGTDGDAFVQTLKDQANPAGTSAPRPTRPWCAGRGRGLLRHVPPVHGRGRRRRDE